MIGAPFNSGTWEGVEAAYYAGMGGGEIPWLILSIALCIVALISGLRHEKHAYKITDG